MAMYVEESGLMYIGGSFYLRDFDSDDQPDSEFNVSLALTQAVDGIEDEGLVFNTAGTGVSVYRSVADQYTFQYVLAGSNNYSEYQQVSHENALSYMYFTQPFSASHKS